MPDVSSRLFRELNDSGHFVLLLDGFDEMLSRVTRADRRRCFNEIAQFVGSRSKLILSGRPGYFPDHSELADVLRGMRWDTDGAAVAPELRPRLHCLQLLDGRELDSFIARENDVRAAVARDLISRNASIHDLARRPVLAGMIVQSAEELKLSGKTDLSVRDLYRVYTDKWVRREEDKGEFRTLVDPEKKATFVRYLAMQMHVDGKLSIHYRNLDSRIRAYFAIDDLEVLDHFSSDIRSCSFLVRSDEGDYRFIHKSFMEYFVAQEFQRLEVSPFAGVFRKPLNSEMIAFLNDETLQQCFLDKRMKIGGLIEALDRHKEELVHEQLFDNAAWLRDLAYQLRKQREMRPFSSMRPRDYEATRQRIFETLTLALTGNPPQSPLNMSYVARIVLDLPTTAELRSLAERYLVARNEPVS